MTIVVLHILKKKKMNDPFLKTQFQCKNMFSFCAYSVGSVNCEHVQLQSQGGLMVLIKYLAGARLGSIKTILQLKDQFS